MKLGVPRNIGSEIARPERPKPETERPRASGGSGEGQQAPLPTS